MMLRVRIEHVLKQLWQLCVFACAWVYVCTKRRSLLATACALTVASVLLLVRWGIVCFNMQSYWHMHRVCLEYSNRAVEGSMCAPMCKSEEIDSLSCQKYYMGKEAVFAATWANRNVIFKSPKRSGMPEPEALYWVDDNSLIHYPNDAEFENMIRNNVKIKFNLTLSDAMLQNMSHFHYGKRSHSTDRFSEMRNLWFLLQDNEYLVMILYGQYGLFPELLGSCGPFYAMPMMKTITQFSHLMSVDQSRAEWLRRVRLALLILDFLRELEHRPPEPLHICDVKLNHFGVTDGFDRVKYLDLDAVHPRSVAGRITGDGSACSRDSDCDFFDCRSRCDRARRRCLHPVSNNNLQVVCEKVFVGWAVAGRLLVPGLLLGAHAPRALLVQLAACADPEREPAAASPPRAPASAQLGNNIYNILSSLQKS